MLSAFSRRLRRFLAHPLTSGLHLNDPRTTLYRRQIVREKASLRQIYNDWYQLITNSLPLNLPNPVLEIGSGPGFFKQHLSHLITSDICFYPFTDLVTDARKLPFKDDSLSAIVMVDVLHHVPDVKQFFSEATRCIHSGGCVAMIETWVTPWSRIMFPIIGHEPFRPDSPNWDFSFEGPLTSSNQALPYIIFFRDRKLFEAEFSAWEIKRIQPILPFRYLLSGGVSMKEIFPEFIFKLVRRFENELKPYMNHLGMFALIILSKKF